MVGVANQRDIVGRNSMKKRLFRRGAQRKKMKKILIMTETDINLGAGSRQEGKKGRCAGKKISGKKNLIGRSAIFEGTVQTDTRTHQEGGELKKF